MTLLLSLLALSITPAQAGSEPQALPQELSFEGPEGLVDEAHAAYTAQDWELAAQLYGSLAGAGAGEAARVMQGLCLYQAGRLREAQAVLTDQPSLEARKLLGLVLVDRGQPKQGRALLEAVQAEATGELAVSASLDLARIALDQGRSAEAKGIYEEALGQAQALGSTALAADAQRGLETVAAMREERPPEGGSGSTASLNALADALRRGAIGAAQGHLANLEAGADTPREQVELGLARGALYRAQGRPDAAAQALMEALTLSRQVGLGWETAQALYGLGIAHGLAGRVDLAVSFLAEAEAEARGGGFEASAVEIGLELGLMALRLGRVEQAAAQLETAQSALASMDHPAAQARAQELAGGLAAASGDLQAANAQLEAALGWHEARGHYADAARVAVALVRANAAQDVPTAERWGERAVALHGQFGDPLGPAQVALAMGLGRADAKDIEGALKYFGEAVELGRASGRAQGAFIADTAEKNAAQALAMLGASEQAAALAASGGLEAALAHSEGLAAALQEYDQGLRAYQEGRFSDAQRRFVTAAERLEELGESAYAAQASKGALWCSYNLAVAMPPTESLAFWGQIQAEAQRLEVVELELRAGAELAIAQARSGHPSAADSLEKAARAAEKGGMPSVAARCWSERAELAGPLERRGQDARRAHALAPGAASSTYALYSVAVDAFNAGEAALARELAELALPNAGELEPDLRGVLEATQ